MSDSEILRSSAPPTPTSNASGALTPRSKVQALLAQFTDSESDQASPTKTSRLPNVSKPVTRTVHDLDDNESEEEVIPQGKLAARLLGSKTAGLEPNNDAIGVKAAHGPNETRPVTEPTITHAEQAVVSAVPSVESSDDELITTRMRKPTTTNRNSKSAASREDPQPRMRRAESPMFFSSPGSSPGSATSSIGGRSRASAPVHTPTDGKSKFLALVEKHRKERIAKEAAEVAKRAAGLDREQDDMPPTRKQRGSSPADDSDEDASSDNQASNRISKAARPTRKASRKAVEEMNRETQRMSRNMQLAHQARTKTKITKESLLARFNFLPTTAPTTVQALPQVVEASSATASEAESGRLHSTPLTSPLREPGLKTVDKVAEPVTDFHIMHGALASEDEMPDVEDLVLQEHLRVGRTKINEYISKNRTVVSPKRKSPAKKAQLTVQHSSAPVTTVQQVRPSLVRSFRPSVGASDSDSDFEIVTEKGQRRKYAAFETLPKRKAKEMPSHLALRSLAHIVANEDKKRSMNAAELATSLRRTARLQALEERRLRIEELRAKGHVIQTAEERERDQQEVEDLVEKARLEAAEIQKREKEMAKKDGTYVKDALDDEDDDDSEDGDFEEEQEDGGEDSGSDESVNNEEDKAAMDMNTGIEDEAEEGDSEEGSSISEALDSDGENDAPRSLVQNNPRLSRRKRVLSDDEDDESLSVYAQEKKSPSLLAPAKTPQSINRSVRKVIPGLQMSDDLPMGLSQAFAATMADSQSQAVDKTSQAQDSFDLVADLPTPKFAPVASLQRMDSLDFITDSQPASQTQPLNINLALHQNQIIPESPARGLAISGPQFTPSQRPFEPTQDAGFMLSPFSGSRFAETPSRKQPQSTVDTVILPAGEADSPVVQRRGKLFRRRAQVADEEEEIVELTDTETAFQVMQRAAKKKAAQATFDKAKSEARQHFDEAAEESEDEYAGLGGVSGDEGDDLENEDDRRMIDEDTQVGRGDEAKLAALYADRERQRDEKDVSKLLRDITTGALRRKRGLGDDLDLSDEEDAMARRREAKRLEFARMRRELLKDEAVGKIAEDKRKEAFLRSIEDRETIDDEEDDFDQEETQQEESQSQSQPTDEPATAVESQGEIQAGQKRKRPLDVTTDKANRLPPALRRTNGKLNRKPATLAEIRESVSFLIEEPDSQAAMVDLGLSDSDEDPEAYIDLNKHLRHIDADENDLGEEDEDLVDFVVDDEPGRDESSETIFKKPDVPRKERAPFSERRTKHTDVIDRLSLLRQSSSSNAASNASNKMAFFASKTASTPLGGVPSLLRRATTNSSLGSMSGRDNVSATGVTTSNGPSRTERGSVGDEKEFIRKGSNGRRNAVNYQVRTTLKEEKMSERAGIAKAKAKGKRKGEQGFLGGLFRGDTWG